MRTILLNPGPVNLSERVRAALRRPDLCHREEEFSELQRGIRAGLLAVHDSSPDAWTAVLLSGSGTAAVEAMLTSLVARDGHLLVLENGVYGERMSAIARIHGIRHTPVSFDWGAEIELDAVRATLARAGDVTHVAVVHHETTTGRLNDLAPLGALCRELGASLLVDAVSSFGGEALDFEAWNLAACAATANKCLHGVPGLAFAIARREALAAGCRPPRTLYLDLASYGREQDASSTPFTPAVPAFYAADEALRELADEGGWRARHARYRARAERVREGLEALGILPFLAPAASSVVLRSYRLPAGLDYRVLHGELKKRGFIIYAGQAHLRKQLFRLSTMGEIDDADLDALVAAFGELHDRWFRLQGGTKS